MVNTSASLLAALLACALLAAPAEAGKATRNGLGDINYVDEGSETNNVTVSVPPASGNYRWTDAASTTSTADAPCTADNTIKAAECPNDNARLMEVALGSGNDKVNASVVKIDMLAFGADGNDDFTLGSGNDLYFGVDGNDIVHAGDGDDRMADAVFAFFGFGGGIAGSGNDQMYGEGGNDEFQAGSLANDGAGADTMDGGLGIDLVEYRNRTGDLSVSVNNPLLGDGSPGENDAVVDVERVRTLAGNDTISDSSADGLDNTFYGMAGNDTLSGGKGKDVLYGGDELGTTGTGDDTLDGGEGADRFVGGDGTDTATYATRSAAVNVSLDGAANDGADGEGDNVSDDVEVVVGGSAGDVLGGSDGRERLRGGDGGDAIDGGDAADTLDGEGGDDVIAARDGAPDTVTCGDGNDMVNADKEDTVAADCELVDRGPADTPPGGAPGGDPGVSNPDGPPILFLVAEKSQKLKKGVRLHLACSEVCSVSLSVRVASKKVAKRLKVKRTYVKRTRTLAGAQQVTLSLKSPRRLRRARKVKVTLVAVAKDPAGHASSAKRPVTLSR